MKFAQQEPIRLHVGCGEKRLEGWVNVDIRPFPGVDLVTDVTQGLELTEVQAVYAEHFLEHLAVDSALRFLAEIRRALSLEGWLRLSTPNLDWVWLTHYRLDAPAEEKRGMALRLNRAFYGWEHKFLWNRETLTDALEAIGYRDLRWCRYGESTLPLFRGIERHETYDDSEEIPHVIIVEARKGKPRPRALVALRKELERDFLAHVAGY